MTYFQFGGDQAAGDKDEMQRLTGNCELRSIILCSHGIKVHDSSLESLTCVTDICAYCIQLKFESNLLSVASS